jgi:hypothetical protein
VTTFRQTGEATVNAVVSTGAGPISGTAALHVRPDRLKIRSITYRSRAAAVLVSVTAVDSAGRPVSRAAVSVVVWLDGRRTSSSHAATGAAGKARFRVPVLDGGCLRTTIRGVSAPGFTWDGRTPGNRYCHPS